MVRFEDAMPSRPENHSTGDIGVAAFQYCINLLKWTFEPVGKDYGLDGKVEVFKENKAVGYMFFVQSKSTEKKISGKKYIAEYFEIQKRNYFLSVNAPIMIILHSTESQTTLYKWAFVSEDFEETTKGYKFIFNTKDKINPTNLDEFGSSVDIARELYAASKSEVLPLRIVAKPSTVIIVQNLFRNTFSHFGINASNSSKSPIEIYVEEGRISCDLYGFIHYEKPFENLEIGMIEIVKLLHRRLKIRSSENFKIIELLYKNDEIKVDDLALYNFIDNIKYTQILKKIKSDLESNDFDFIPQIIGYAQLNFYKLDPEGQQILIDIRREIHIHRKDDVSYTNRLLVLQAASGSNELLDLLLEYDTNNLSIDYNDRFLIEYANAAQKCLRMDLVLSALSRIKTINTGEAEYLRVKSLISSGRYFEAMELVNKVNNDSLIYSAFIPLAVYLNFVVHILKVNEQVIKLQDRPEFLQINTTSEAFDYLINVDATHPHAWLILSQKSDEELPYLNEPEFYAAFGAFLGHGRLLFRQAFLLLVQKIYSDNENRDVLSAILANLLEEALSIRDRNFIDYLFSEFTATFDDEEILADIMRTFEEIESHFNNTTARFLDHGDGFTGNAIYLPSILQGKSDFS